MNLISADFFANYALPASLKAGKHEKLAFLIKQANIDDNFYESNLWLFQDEQLIKLTHEAKISSFWWLPNGHILFPRFNNKEDKTRAKTEPLTVFNCIKTNSPGEAKELFRLPFDVQDLLALPDGRFLFTATYNPKWEHALQKAKGNVEKANEIMRQNGDVQIITEHPFWENASGFVCEKRTRLWLYDGVNSHPITDETTNIERFCLALNANYAYFVATSFEKTATLENKLFELNLSTLKTEDISLKPVFCHTQIVPLANGTLLVFGTGMEAFGINQNGAFYLLHPNTKEVKTLYDKGLYNGYDALDCDLKMSEEALWQAKGENVFFTCTLNENVHLMKINTNSGEIMQLTEKRGNVLEFALTKNGRVFITAMRSQNGAELYEVFQNADESPKSTFNLALHSSYSMQKPKPLSIINNEGNKIDGWVLPPANLQENKAYPAILYVHGGPKMAYGEIINHEMQYLASCGFCVFYCNPTGSDGKGDDFADVRGRYGLVDYDDLMLFTNKVLAENDWIDPARLGVCGGSYGGFMVNWLIGHTNIFSAAVSQRGISNWLSMALTSDIGMFFVPDQIGEAPLDNPDALWQASPLKYARAVFAPTLFIHSNEDYRCFYTESLQMYTALHTQGVQTRLCLFNDENHNLSRNGKPQNRIRRLKEISAWFKQHLL